MSTDNKSTQRQLMLAINIFSVVFLYWFITQVTRAYIGLAYPDVSPTTVSSLISLPNLFGLISSRIIGPIAIKVKKGPLAGVAIASVVLYCLIFYVNGKAHGPFGIYYIGCVLAGIAQGTHAALLNGLLGLHFQAEERGRRIANYNVWLNIGALIVLQVSGIIAARNDGAQWYNAYLLGIFPLVGCIIFLAMTSKIHADVPTIVQTENPAAVQRGRISDIPKKAFPLIIALALGHACFYIAQFAFNTNVSNYIITEYNLGTSAQAGTASSLVRLSMIIFTALFPVFKKVLKGWMVACGYLCAAIGLTIMMVGKSLPAAFICAIFIGAATGMSFSAVYEKATSFVPALCVSLGSAIVTGITNIGSSTSTYIMAAISNPFGGSMPVKFVVGIVFALIATLIAIYMFVIRKDQPYQEGE